MNYRLKVFREASGVSALDIAAATAEDAIRQAESQGYRVIESRQVRSHPFSLLSRTQRFNVPLFSQELLTLLDAGLNIVEALDTLARKQRNDNTRAVLQALMQQLKQGRSFSQALESQSEHFSTLFIATVRSSERTANLPDALRRYLDYMRQINGVRDRVVAALIYPVLLMLVGGLVILFLLGYVVPRFAKVYEDVGDRLPWMSRLLMEWGQFVEGNGGGIAIASLLALAGLLTLLRRPRIRSALQGVFWRLPRVGEVARTYELARFSRTLSMLLAGGVPFVQALGMTGTLLSQPALRTGLDRAQKALGEGRRVSDVFLECGLASEVGARMLAVGERSGELPAMTEKVARMYDEDIARTVDWFSRLFEPLLMVLVGLTVGAIILLMYLPIFELANLVQ